MDCACNVAYLRRVMERFGFGARWAYWDAINDVYHGLSRAATSPRSIATPTRCSISAARRGCAKSTCAARCG